MYPIDSWTDSCVHVDLSICVQKISVTPEEEKAYNLETMKTYIKKRSGDLMMDLEALQKNNNLQTPVSSFNVSKALSGK